MMNKEKFIELLSKKFLGTIAPEEGKLLDKVSEDNEEYRLLSLKLGSYLKEKKNYQPKQEQLGHTWETIIAAENRAFNERFDYSSPKKRSFIQLSPLKVAIMLVLFIGIGLLGYRLLIHNTNQQFDSLATTSQKTFKMLDDGTRVWLNKKSTMRYNKDFGKHKREIMLEGEAYFDVVKNKNTPLFIHAGNIDIEVKGTAFNVNAYKESAEIEVALVRGAVQVTDRFHNNHQILLKPNDKLIFSRIRSNQNPNNFRVITLVPTVLLKDIKWTADTLVFHKEKLKDLVLRLEKKYDLKIEIQSTQLKEKRFSGMFTTETLQQALEALKLSYPLTYTISNRTVFIKD